MILWGLYLLLLPDVPLGEEVWGKLPAGYLLESLWGYSRFNSYVQSDDQNKILDGFNITKCQSRDEGYTTTLGWENPVGEYGVLIQTYILQGGLK
ncbi:MAG: hypothetical protein Ct9H300mP2_0360 [Candidatus Neomarinimicrobiota bacterium]|nr:MAG: hypothetical protein Ct9H300mP2_0360 [Candidatus Neomarinimicrobiota bacterium]